MLTRKPLIFLIIAALAGSVIFITKPTSTYDQQLIAIQANQSLRPIDKDITKEPTEIQAILLDYSSNKVLLMKAILALKVHPEQTVKVLTLYGEQPQFQQILMQYGECIIPVINYFLTHDLWSVSPINAMKNATNQAEAKVTGWLDNIRGQSTDENITSTKPTQDLSMTPEERGFYAINYIAKEGYPFIGQFDIGSDHLARWNITSRAAQDTVALFTSGVQNLERKYDENKRLTASDYAWGAVDVIPVFAALKFVRVGKVVVDSAKAGEDASKAASASKVADASQVAKDGTEVQKLSIVERTGLLGKKLAPAFLRGGKYAAYIGTAYVLITHPSLITNLLEELSKLLGIPAWLGVTLGWMFIIFILLYPLTSIVMRLLGYLYRFLFWLNSTHKKIDSAMVSNLELTASNG